MAAAPPIVACHESPEAAAEAEREWWHRLVSGIVAECGVDGLSSPSRFDRYFDDLYLHFATSAAWALYDDVLPALEELRSTGVAAGLITNYDSRVYRLLDSLGLTPWLDSVTIPAIAGSSKPDARIFAFALAQKGLAPGQAAHVGDSVEEDYRAAEDAGLVAVLLDRDDRHAAVTHMRRARGLAEALARVERAS